MTNAFEQIPIDVLLPQRPPFVLVDALTASDGCMTSTRYAVAADGLFTADGCLTPEGLLENMAQTCAARLGYANYLLRQRLVVGVIAAVSGFTVLRLPRVGEVLTTRIDAEVEIFGLMSVSAEVRCCDDVVARANIKMAVRRARPDFPL